MALLTNSLIPCNGRFPFLIIVGSLLVNFIAPQQNNNMWTVPIAAAAMLLALAATFVVSRLLTGTLLRGEASFFFLELPPYRCLAYSSRCLSLLFINENRFPLPKLNGL